MLKKLIIFHLLYSSAFGIIPIKGKDTEIIDNYLKLHTEFSQEVCPADVEPRYWDLFKKFNSGGYYTPIDYEDNIDTKVVELHIRMIIEKEKWIKNEIAKFEKITTLKNYFVEIKDLEILISELLDLKEQYFDENDLTIKDQVLRNSGPLYEKFRIKLRSFLERLTFLQTFKFPVDHLELRRKYDSLKHRNDKVGKSEGNMIYFVRKIYEDGAQDKDHSRSDMFLRTSINALFLKLEQKEDFLSEDIRSDVVYVLDKITSQLKRGQRKILERLLEWQRRTAGAYVFYSSLLKNDEEGLKLRKMLSLEKAHSRKNLKEYSLLKQAESFEFWSKQTLLNRALYSLSTILYNEVGRIDGEDALERKDVLQVVINRSEIKFYNQLSKEDSILEYLINRGIEKYNEYPWLNVLFKEGEFSFTYYFINGNLRIYCPSKTRVSRFLRKENLNLALKLLRSPNYDFKGLRYFSRGGMLGRIDMSGLWVDYLPIPERAGNEIKNSKRLSNLYDRKKYEYYYHFIDPNGKIFKVVEIKNNKYAYYPQTKTFYKYRNRHHFRYFKKGPENTHVEQ
ncbi:MAG: hypothetical protein H6622_00925 [Halobacteriovoraceae bacterium]|nr:hypothetical protein [Halobacteriovoraceae bacterium]